jgi:uncharacterized protein YhfF
MFPRVSGHRSIELGLPGEQRARLLGFVLHGRKRATAGLLAEYDREGEALEHVGEELALLDDAGQPVAWVRVTRVELRAFADVPWEFAEAEAEGDTCIEDWRQGHLAFWTTVGEVVTDTTPVVLIWFELLPRGYSPV